MATLIVGLLIKSMFSLVTIRHIQSVERLSEKPVGQYMASVLLSYWGLPHVTWLVVVEVQ